jgi:Domain of unknown function (DUF6430)
MSSRLNKQLEYFFRRETLVKVANNFLVIFGTLWLFTESAAFFFSEYLSSYRSALFLVIFASAFISSLVLSFPKLQHSRAFTRLNVEVAVTVGDVLKEIEDGACNVVFGASDTFTVKTERIAGKQSIRSQLANKFYQGNSHLFDKDIVDSLSEKRLVDEISGTYKVPVGSVGVVKIGDIKIFCLVNKEKVVGKTTNISKENLWLALCNLWETVKNKGGNYPIIVPVLGAGFGRAPASRISLIQLILMSFAVSNREFRITKKLTIMIHEQDYSPSEMSEVIAFIDALDL